MLIRSAQQLIHEGNMEICYLHCDEYKLWCCEIGLAVINLSRQKKILPHCVYNAT